MDKISINLNPRKEKAESVTVKKLVTYTPTAGMAAMFLLAVIIVAYLFIFFLGGVHNRYERKWAYWEPRFKEIAQIKQEILTLDGQKKDLEQVTKPILHMPKVMGELFSSFPKNMWLERLSYKKNVIALRGYVVKIKDDYLFTLDRFVSDLKSKEYFHSKFKKINIKDSKKIDFFGAEVSEFNIECVK